MTPIPSYPMNDGRTIPALGFGTYRLRGEEGIAAIVSALHIGYRLLDTALNYGNEREVGEAIRRSGDPARGHHGDDQAARAAPRVRVSARQL